MLMTTVVNNDQKTKKGHEIAHHMMEYFIIVPILV